MPRGMGEHGSSNQRIASIESLAGHDVEGDAHKGETVGHRSRVAVDPTQPNLSQVHLIHAELFGELAATSFEVGQLISGDELKQRNGLGALRGEAYSSSTLSRLPARAFGLTKPSDVFTAASTAVRPGKLNTDGDRL